MSDFLSDILAGERSAIIRASALYFAVMGAWSVAYCFRLRRWPSVVGTLEEAGLGRFGASSTRSDQTFRANVLYRYEVDGESFEGARLSPSIMLVSANARGLLSWQMKGIERIGEDGVRVFYNPSKPRKSFLIVPPNRTIAIVAIAMFGAAALIWMAL